MANIKRASGSNASYSMQLEREFGVTPTNTDDALKLRGLKAGESMDVKIALEKSEEITGNKGTKNGSSGNKTVDGSLPLEFSATDLCQELLVYCGMGEVTQTPIVWNGQQKFKKVYKRKQIKNSVTLERCFNDIMQFQRFSGVMINSMAISLTQTGLATLTFETMGKDFEYTTLPYFVDPLNLGHTTIASKDAKRIEIRGANKCISSLTVTVDNALSGQNCIGLDTISQMGEDLGSVTGNYTTYFENTEEYEDVLIATIFEITFRVYHTDDNYVEIYLPSVQYDASGGFTPKIDSTTTLTPQMAFAGNSDDTEGTDIVITYVNDNDIQSYITAPVEPVIPVTSISVAPTTQTLTVSQYQILNVTFNPNTVVNKNVTVLSSNPSVAIGYFQDGSVTVQGIAVGTSTITVKSEQDPTKTATCVITVE